MNKPNNIVEVDFHNPQGTKQYRYMDVTFVIGIVIMTAMLTLTILHNHFVKL